ncbi:MAG: beta-propeller domain-containing protein [Methylococcaceae bacterium]|nr:beta-propeller domain-containing protein [Methylococcaceae bacterium]
MKISIALLSCLYILSFAHANTFVPISKLSTHSDITFKYDIQNKDNNENHAFLSNEPIDIHVTIDVKKNDIAQYGSLFLVAQYNETLYQYTLEDQWVEWKPQESALLPFLNKVLNKQEVISIVENQTLPAGEFLIYTGYQTERDQIIYHNKVPSSLVVFDSSQSALHKVKNKQILTELFSHKNQRNQYFSGLASIPSVTSFSPVNTSANTSVTSVSQTNIQEVGVDESDRIKTDGNHLYTLESCDSDPLKECITVYKIDNSPASNTQSGQLGNETNLGQQGSLYLKEVNNNNVLIHLSNSSNFSINDTWYLPSFWQNNNTDIRFIDVSQPDKISIVTHMTIDSATLSSRLIDDVLYLVTRKNPSFIDSTSDTTKFTADVSVLTKELDINDQLPTISFNENSDKTPLIKATDCFIPSHNSQKPTENTVITITAIPLTNPKSYYSTCIAGNIDTFYMSTKSLYLASSQYPVSFSENSIIYNPGDAEMETEIHKFSLAKGQLNYRGSGSISGHLGWNTSKQAFRMGEYEGVLKVATSKGNQWDETSSTSVSVLKESSDRTNLEEISSLHNLGKPGERLFAARFIGTRGYLVTFKQTDPLYVLNFKDPELPEILGELEVQGYSDYLHPIGENYLLGIGKNAISGNEEDSAFFQGIKLSLFDVSNAKNLREVKSIIIGKRGTESAVLQDHHALAWLPSEKGNSATLSIPIQLNDRKQTQNNPFLINADPASYYYEWTHTGLYTFNISTDTPDIKLLGKLLTDKAPENCNEFGLELDSEISCFQGQQTYNDRAVIQGNSVHYFHNNSVFSSAISDLE